MDRTAVILIDHGSQRADADEPTASLAAILAGRAGVRVYPAHMAMAEPTFAQAVASAVAAGAERIIVAPCFLGVGRHVTETIPALLARARADHGGISFDIADPIGADPALAAILMERIRPLLSDEAAE